MNTADDGSPGCLRWCIAQAQSGDEIQFDPSLDGQPIMLTSGQLVIDKDLTIAGRGSNKTILSGRGGRRGRVMQVGSPWEPVITTTTISGVMVTEGK